ncbi:YhdP family protein [Vibrio gallaecicus]|uniref:YhdP family protein n=1 Tax=Vibrio gallaecicus TaxID=552386 RepID=UPI0010CA1E44|nr:YhdP family protein [Vibrio gallaecicus]MDN3617781.1 YhdP family protein [Vibrio gallaecicus]
MSSGLTRLLRALLWLVVTVLVMLAIAVTTLRVALPNLNKYQSDIESWVNQNSGFEFSIQDVSGFWRNTHPSIAIQGVKAIFPQSENLQFSVERVEVEFDLIQSVLLMQPVVTDLIMNEMAVDVRSLDILGTKSKNDSLEVAQESLDSDESSKSKMIKELDNFLLKTLVDFTVKDSSIQYVSISGEERQLDIEHLKWRNSGEQHLAEGVVSIKDANLNSLSVSANFIDGGSLVDVSGEFYVSADSVSIQPWLTHYMQAESGIKSGTISLNSWLTLKNSKPVDAYVEVLPSELSWTEDGDHDFLVESGVFKLSPTENGWQVNGHSLNLRTDDTQWPELDVAFDWQHDLWHLNVSQVEVSALTPLIKLMPDSATSTKWIEKLNPAGVIEDIRVSMGEELESLRYSASFRDMSLKQWDLLPGFNHVSGRISGSTVQAYTSLSVIDDVFPYGEVFQAPLNIKQGQVDIVWQQDESGWRLWSDKVTAATPDLQVLGAFRLDFPNDSSPFLSFYGEADAYNVGETWRYLPTLALGQDLTDYLSTAIQGGKAETVKLLWHGELAQYPYSNNEGTFQVWVGLEEAKFSFDTAWPLITDLQLDLLFENDAMYLDSRSAQLMDVKAKRITGRIPYLGEGGHIEIEASAAASGNAVRNYMTSTPLVDSVGAALTALQVDGKVDSKFQLYIPFDSNVESRAWGYADLKGNHVDIKAPPITLENVTGRIEFDNDVVTANGLAAELLEQGISVDFKGENEGTGYVVDIDVLGDWDTDPLVPYIGERWLSRISGHAPWQTGIDIQLNDIGFTYQLDLQSDLKFIASEYPYPLAKKSLENGALRLQASGNQESITARLQLPNSKYQTEIDITGEVPVLTATNLVLGRGGYKISPVVGHNALIRTDKFNLDDWLSVTDHSEADSKAVLSTMNTPEIPMPERVTLESKQLTLAGIQWNDVDFKARKQNSAWKVQLKSQEVEGDIHYLEPYDLSVSLDRLHVFVPEWSTEKKSEPLLKIKEEQAPLISNFDRKIHDLMPNVTLLIDDLWLQGYKVGEVNVELLRQEDRIEWEKIQVRSGTNKADISGWWKLDGDISQSTLNVDIEGENNSELMERFGITSGIQKAPFELQANMTWDGSPWGIKTDTLDGNVETKFGKGIISDVSGAARLLGLFSLDSIIRKMQLDFSDVFDKGMAFNSITGTGEFQSGIFLTNDLNMDAVAGEMQINGIANLNTRLVDAEVNFTPDITSGIPVLTAFAVTPQTALYVLAITTVISPVVEVFTQVNYSVKGPLDSPTVSELSRRKGEFKLPEKLRKLAE